MQDQETSRENRLSFYQRQQAVRGKEIIPDEVLEEATGKPASDGGPTNFFEAIRKAFGAPLTLTVSGFKVRIESPTVDGLLKFIADAQEIERRQPANAEEEVLRLLKSLMVDCLEFPESAPADVNAWIGKLRAVPAAELLEGFSKVLNYRMLMEQVSHIRGKAANLGVRASPGKN